MLMNGLVRTGLGLAVGALLVTSLTGCRSTSTDRIRVLEAQKAASERKNQELNEQAAELRARQIEKGLRTTGLRYLECGHSDSRCATGFRRTDARSVADSRCP